MGIIKTQKMIADQIVANTERVGDCLIWRGLMASGGYGRLCWRCETRAHRVVYMLTHGLIPDGMVVRHRCDTPACVEPTHLELGTPADNCRDARERGGMRTTGGKASKHPCELPLTQRQRDILSFMVAWEASDGLVPTIRQIGRHFGITSTNGVSDHLKYLERKQAITRDGRLRITPRGYAEVGASPRIEAA